MSEAVRVRAYDWLGEKADPTVAEHVEPCAAARSRHQERHQFRWLAGIGVSILGVVVGLGIFS